MPRPKSQKRHSAPGKVPAASDTGAVLMQAPDVLHCVLRSQPAGEASIWLLHVVQLVCKIWRVSVRHVLADAQWLAPFLAAAEAFLRQVPVLQEEDDWTALVLGMRTY